MVIENCLFHWQGFDPVEESEFELDKLIGHAKEQAKEIDRQLRR